MARIIILTVTAITLLWLPDSFAAAVDEPNDNNAIRSETFETGLAARKPKPKADFVTMVDFYLRDGNTVSGRMLSDDSTQVVIEQPLDSTIITKTYSKREIDTRTLRTRAVLESQYYTRLAEYFAAKTWDFRDDPDEFILAIRCYEKAKQSLEQSGAEPERIAEIDKSIQKIKADKEVWTSQVESRAQLKKLEYEAEAENRLKQLEKQVAENSAKLMESIKYLDKTAADLKSDYEKVEKTIAGLNKDFVQQINALQAQLRDDEAVINDLSYRLFWIQRPPGGGGK